MGSSDFVESILKEAEEKDTKRSKTQKIDLDTLKKRICADFQINLRALDDGNRVSSVSHARAVLSYVWIRHLGKSGRQLADALGVSPQAVYSFSAPVD